MLPKTSAYVKSYERETKWMFFLLKMMSYQKYVTVFGAESATVLKKNLIANASTIKISKN